MPLRMDVPSQIILIQAKQEEAFALAIPLPTKLADILLLKGVGGGGRAGLRSGSGTVIAEGSCLYPCKLYGESKAISEWGAIEHLRFCMKS